MNFERRQYPRYRASDVRYYVFYRYSYLMRKLKNISVDGLGYEYVSVAGSEPDAVVFDIVGPRSNRFYLPEISCRKIYDLPALSELGTFSGVETRLCGYQYVNLTDEQHLKLEFLLNRCIQC
jgi:hypothetical protein